VLVLPVRGLTKERPYPTFLWACAPANPKLGDQLVPKTQPPGTTQQTDTSASDVPGRQATSRFPVPRWGRGVANNRISGASFEASFIGEQAVLSIWGELDVCAEHEFRTILDAVIDCGHGSVELDLDHLNFMDASGLRVIACGKERLREGCRALTFRSASPVVLRALDITGFTRLVNGEGPDSLGLAMNSAAHPDPSDAPPGRLVQRLSTF
jgi:anti-anti-sigma factor